MKYFLILLFSIFFFSTQAQVERKSALAGKVSNPPRIDGKLDDPAWQDAIPITGFTQYLPIYNTAPSFPSKVMIIYDDQAVYIGAILSDEYPDSIPMQLGNRDDENMNVDYLQVQFDTYNNQLDAYTFIITSAGVQVDYRETDESYDAVWTSNATLFDKGWMAEMKIPYSALRFPGTDVQQWGMQIVRSFRRNREFDQWSLEKQGADNTLVYWGLLNGITNIKPPVRLSLTPYFAVAAEHYPNDNGDDLSYSFGGGMDMKYGINESFTIDMTLLPDFSQVQSDNKVKNLTAFETVYEEQRPFFNEAIDLFEKGDLFYSRRIGKIPVNFLTNSSQLLEGEKIVKNPVQQRLLNATKLSGRTRGGLAIGLMNAVTANTYAIVENEDAEQRKILTDPASNYNMIVLAQSLKNNSEVFISNTNLVRAMSYDDANVTAAGIKLNNKSNSYVLNINGGASQIFSIQEDEPDKRQRETGYKFYTGIGKTNGNFQFTLLKGFMDDKFNANDMGITLYNNYHLNYVSVSYNVYQPWWKLRDLHSSLVLQNENNYSTGKVQTASLEMKNYGTTMKYLTVWLNGSYDFMETFDYYETRTKGRYYRKPSAVSGNIGFSSDYRKTFALDIVLNAGAAKEHQTFEKGINIHPILRLNNHLLFSYNFSSLITENQMGYANSLSSSLSDSIIFGKRDITTITNTLNAKYLFRNNLSLNLNTRHYWSKGKYNTYYLLDNEGRTGSGIAYNGNHDFNFNAFTVDMVFSWIFAPGSSLNIVWKNAINPPDENVPVPDFFTNLKNTFDAPQQNTLSLKILYYFDYQQLRRHPGK